jgi:scyllo-inositol 2-dehydrogenase (NADP+)
MQNSTIHTALCSFGMSGRVFHAPFLHIHPLFRLYGVLERTHQLAAAAYPGIISFPNLEAMLADPAIELVIVNTPNYTHYDYTRLALEAGKHVVVEKPFTTTSKEAQELTELAAAKKRILSVYQNRRYDSDYRTIKQVLEAGWLGNIIEAEFHFDRYKEAPGPKLHKEEPGPGAGALYDLGSHIIDQALQLFGWPKALFADIAVMRPLSKVDDYFEIILYYPSFRVRLKCSYQVKEALPGYILHGSKGSFIKPKTDVQETQLQAGAIPGGADWGTEPDSDRGLLHTDINGQVSREYIPSLKGNYGDYYEGIFQAIVNGQAVPVTGEEGRNVICIIEAAFKSSNSGAVIQL